MNVMNVMIRYHNIQVAWILLHSVVQSDLVTLMKTVFGIVLYNKAFEYINELFESVNSQNTSEFELLIINDDIDSSALSQKLNGLNRECAVIKYNQKYSPIELRIKLLLEAKNMNANLLIIGDADDVFSSDRVSCTSVLAIQHPEYSFFYNGLVGFENQQIMPNMPKKTMCIEDIASYNYLGMSNTSIRVDRLSKEFIESLSECNNPIFDWYLFSRLLLEGYTGLFVPCSLTFYRFHVNNTVGNQQSNPDRIEYEVSVKLNHYQSLSRRYPLARQLYLDYLHGDYRTRENVGLSFWWGYTESIHNRR